MVSKPFQICLCRRHFYFPPVYHSPVLLQPEHPRLEVPHLRRGRDRANLHEAETHVDGQAFRGLAILVETGRNPDRVTKIEAESGATLEKLRQKGAFRGN